jgi:glycosyltransferase involved in cell wall biosynthesis
VLDDSCGRVVAAGDVDQLVESLRWFAANRELLPQMKKAARTRAESFTWEQDRAAVSGAVASFV